MSPPAWLELSVGSRALRIEYRWIEPSGAAAPPAPSALSAPSATASPSASSRPPPCIVFLHEGLGSLSMWRDFPDRLCAAVGARGLVYSRPGYGRSTPRAPGEAWGPDFMHQQAWELLPALRAALGLADPAQPPWLLGHSDGGSIALLHAAHPPAPLAGVVVLAPHILVEPVSLASIARAREAYVTGDLRARLARHHEDPDSAFWGWNQAWLNPAFRTWSIEAEIARITAPVLAIQGLDDEYGTLEQIRGIARRLPHTQLLELPRCGHSPHRDQPETVVAAVAAFIGERHGLSGAQGQG